MSALQALLALLLLSLSLYLILGGADFGAGIWELGIAGPGEAEDRALLRGAIGPVWEANHVWLIFSLILFFACAPLLYSAVLQALWLPLLLALAGIFFRGMAYALRPFSRIFSAASLIAPFFLGACVGSLAAGGLSISEQGFQGDVLRDWARPLAFFCGLFTVSICAFTSASFLSRECQVRQLKPAVFKRWRARALASGLACGALSLFGLALCRFQAQGLADALQRHAWLLVLGSIFCGSGALLCLVKGWGLSAVILASGAAANVVWAWGLAEYFLLMSGGAWGQPPEPALNAMLICVLLGLLLVLPPLFYLFRFFKAFGPKI